MKQILDVNQPFLLASGKQLKALNLEYETWGTLNSQKTNAVLVCHALTASSHAASSSQDPSPGWWQEFIGPNKSLDTNKYFVICVSNLGSCYGTTGPHSINPETKAVYGEDFPQIEVSDWVECQKMIQEHLGIPQWLCIIGGSLGGMQAMQWALSHPESSRGTVAIASTMRLSLQNRAFSHIALESINRASSPEAGLAMARMVGHITYLSPDLEKKFSTDLDRSVETYLTHQGDKFAKESGFDAVSYAILVRALNKFDIHQGDLTIFREKIIPYQGRFLICSFTSDWRFPSSRSLELASALVEAKKTVSYLELEDDRGHDSFLFASERYRSALKHFLINCQKGL